MFRNLRYHWRENLAVVLGVAVGAAVLTGSLLVGDSLRGSLRDRAERQLRGVQAAYLGSRLIRDHLADQLSVSTAPVLMITGAIENSSREDQQETRRIGRVSIFGVDHRFAPSAQSEEMIDWDGQRPGVALSHRLAERLGVKLGDRITLELEQQSNIPRSSLLGRRDEEHVTRSLRARVSAILSADDPAGDFSLNPGPTAPLNVYVPLRVLQNAVDQPGRVNALLIRPNNSSQPLDVPAINASFHRALTADDLGLLMKPASKRQSYVSVESRQMILEPKLAEAVLRAARHAELRAEPTMVYLANWITNVRKDNLNRGLDALLGGLNRQQAGRIPYSVVAGLNASTPPPLGPFLPEEAPPLADDEILLVDWPGSPLRDSAPGDAIALTYFEPELESGVRESTARFRLRSLIPIAGAADDPDLTPPFPGVTDKPSIEKWDPPFPYDPKRVGKADEDYWDHYRATPKAYITWQAAARLFGSRFGNMTSIRVAPKEGMSQEDTIQTLDSALRQTIDYTLLGITIEDLHQRLQIISQGGTDFGMLFLGFSLFLIAAALLLVGLLFRLALERRAKEVGLLLACGFTPWQVRRLLLGEGLILAALGAAAGVLLGFVFNRAMLDLLAWLWPDSTVRSFLKPHLNLLSLLVGGLSTLAMALAAIAISCRGLGRVPAPALLRGETQTNQARSRTVHMRDWVLAGMAFLGGVGGLLVGRQFSNPDFRAMSFFLGGALLLTGSLFFFSALIRRPTGRTIDSRGWVALVRLAARNARRHPRRSLLTASLLAAATFLLVAVESFRRQPDQEFQNVHGGSGGFNLLAEAAIPLFQRFDDPEGLALLEESLQRRLNLSSRDPRLFEARTDLQHLQPSVETRNVFPFRLRGGDDASCLNLYQADRPRLLGVPEDLIQRGGFRFADVLASTAEQKANPWLLLSAARNDDAIPAIVEQNTALWMLKTAVGGRITVPDQNGQAVPLRIVATLVDSPFQSEILISDSAFRQLFPREEGYRVFLIRTPLEKESSIARWLSLALAGYGFELQPTRERVAAYQAVIGAYLSAFQVLGGLGLLLGVFGLAIVILRAVWERLAELALFRAIGYRYRDLQVLVLVENLLLLVVGMSVGLVAALVSVSPHIATGATLPWLRLGGMLVIVLAVGFAVALMATAGMLKVPLIPALRRE